MRTQTTLKLLLSILFVGVSTSAMGAITLPSIIGSQMVLQRDQPVPIWGWDDPGTTVSVTMGAHTVSATADDSGRWEVSLPATTAGGPHELVIKGTDEKTLTDVLFGEVWLCSGQSNMEWVVSNSNNSQEEIANANFPQIRHIKIQRTPKADPQTDVAASGWQAASPQTVGSFTAVGYFFGRKLHQELNVPIGLIGSNWGGTRIEPWTPPVGFQSVPALKTLADKLDEFPRKHPNGDIDHQSPLALYNGMIAPLVPYKIRGALWYQGESNNGEGMIYHEKMKALINGWRSIWKQPELPFYFVQLAPYKYGGNPENLPGIWEAQTATLSVPHTGMAVTHDIGNLTDIHPRNKQDVGARLARWALNKDYGKSDVYVSGPIYKCKVIEGNSIRINFEYVGDGLVSSNGEPLNHFQIAGEDGGFVDATAEIDGETVVVSAEGIESPKHVRFAWHQLAEPNLANKNGLPASPFRTDK